MRQLFGRPEHAHIRVEMLSAFLDNQVSPAERARVEGHLSTCAACRSELESLRRTVALLHALPRVAVPRAFTLSEAKAGVRRPESRPVWLGGLARGLGAVTAVALVAVVAATVLRQPAAAPGGAVARSAPTAAMMEKAVEQPAAAVAPAAAPVVAEEQLQSAAAAETDAATSDLAMGQAVPTAEPAEPEVAPAPAVESAPAARGMAPTATPEPAMMALAPPASEATPAPSAKAFGLGGAGAAAALPAELMIPEPTPPIAPAIDVLPAAVRLVYADLKGLWAIDGVGGVRQLAAAEMLNTPLISPDGSYVVYRVLRRDAVELWGVRWDGGAPRLLLNESELAKEGLGAEYTERRLQDVRWTPGGLTLAVNIVRVPSPRAPEALPQVELWELDVTTGALRYLAPLGRAYRPLYSPDGSRFALLEYGTEADPQGRLVLFDADGGNQRVAVTFPASPAKLSYDSQMAWLPDSSALLLAVPIPDPPVAGQFNGTTLYRVDAAGQAEEVGSVDASQVAWSPDGVRLAYLRITSDTMEDGELYLAAADGSGAERYATVKTGAFLAWSPDAVHFLYQDSYETYLGTVGGAPQRLGTSVSFVDPRWVSATQFVSFHDAETAWLLTLRGIDGAAWGLIPLPREAMLDVMRP